MVQVTIRHAERDDAAAIQAIYAQPHAYGATLQLPHPSVAMWQGRFDSQPAGYTNLVAVVDGRVVGQLGLISSDRPRRKHVAQLGMAVCASVLGQGVGSALLGEALWLCDRWLNIQRVELEVFTDNERAIALYRKQGFVVEGEHKGYAFKDGILADVLSMARLRAVAG